MGYESSGGWFDAFGSFHQWNEPILTPNYGGKARVQVTIDNATLWNKLVELQTALGEISKQLQELKERLGKDE